MATKRRFSPGAIKATKALVTAGALAITIGGWGAIAASEPTPQVAAVPAAVTQAATVTSRTIQPSVPTAVPAAPTLAPAAPTVAAKAPATRARTRTSR